MNFLRRFGAELLRSALIAFVISGGFASAAMYQWSTTAGTNASADPTINFREGQAPSSLNDSARALMAVVAGWRDDTSGLLTTGGTSTAYTVTTNQVLNATPNDGQLLAVTMHATNGVSPTLAADGGSAFPIQSSPGVAVGAATLVQGTPYTLKFSVSNNAWMLRNYYGNAFQIPLGGVMAYTPDSSPNSNFVMANGQCISRMTYAAYFALVGTRYSGCDGSTTFGVPDLRGRIIAGLDNMGGASNANRLSSVMASGTNGGVGGGQTQSIAQANLPNVNFTLSASSNSSTSINDPGHIHSSVNTGTTIVVGEATPLIGINTGNLNAPGTLVDLRTFNTGNSFTGITASTTTTTTGSAASGGSGTALPIVQPTMTLNFILRVI